MYAHYSGYLFTEVEVFFSEHLLVYLFCVQFYAPDMDSCEESTVLLSAQGVNDALGIGATPGGQASWGAPMGAAPGDFGEAAKIWSDPHVDQQQQQFNPMHGHHRK